MKAKLIKTDNEHYVLVMDDKDINVSIFKYTVDSNYGFIVADKFGGYLFKLSLKNCQAIENGYDVWELAFDYAKKDSDSYTDFNKGHRDGCYMGFFAGFQKALSILGDKKFSEEALYDSIMLGVAYEDLGIQGINNFSELKELAVRRNTKTEWEVEIEMTKSEYILTPQGEGFEDQTTRGWRNVPKIDSDGCLILNKKL